MLNNHQRPGGPLFYRDYWNFVGGDRSAAQTFLFAAYIGFVNFADTGELPAEILIFLHSDTNAMSHIPRDLIGDRKLALKFFRRDALFVRAN